MSTLAEIEAVVESLPTDKKEELLRFITARLRAEASARPRPAGSSRSRRGFPISKGRLAFTSAEVKRIESQADTIEQ